MALSRKVGLYAGAKYKGGGPMLAWALHRISGLGIIIFVTLHVLASFLTQQMGSDLGIFINIIYESIYFQLFIVFCAIFHGVNGFQDHSIGYLAAIDPLSERIHLAGMVCDPAPLYPDSLYHDPAFPGGLISHGGTNAIESYTKTQLEPGIPDVDLYTLIRSNPNSAGCSGYWSWFNNGRQITNGPRNADALGLFPKFQSCIGQ